MSILSYDQQKSLRELFIVLEKGIDLLANENLDKDLYEAYEKYATSTIKMVNESYGQNYIPYSFNDYSYIPHDSFNPINPFNNHIPCGVPINSFNDYSRNAYISVLSEHNHSAEYRNKLKNLLKQLILLAQKVVYE